MELSEYLMKILMKIWWTILLQNMAVKSGEISWWIFFPMRLGMGSPRFIWFDIPAMMFGIPSAWCGINSSPESLSGWIFVFSALQGPPSGKMGQMGEWGWFLFLALLHSDSSNQKMGMDKPRVVEFRSSFFPITALDCQGSIFGTQCPHWSL